MARQVIIAQTPEVTAQDLEKIIQLISIVNKTDVLQMFVDMDIVQPMTDENGALYTDTDGKLFIL